MSRNGSVGIASASRVETHHSKSIYAADMGPPRPLRPEWDSKVEPNSRKIEVGSVEELPHGTLRCFRRRGKVVVELRKLGELVGRRLELTPSDPALLQDGALIHEGAFSVEVDEFVGTPWHEDEYTSVWTVHGLRTRGEMELTVAR